MGAIKQAEITQGEIETLENEIRSLATDIDAIEAEIKRVIVKDESKGRELIKQKSGMTEKKDFLTYKRDGLREKLAGMQKDILLEKRGNTQKVFDIKTAELRKAITERDELEKRFTDSRENVALLQLQVSNVSGQLGELDYNLQNI